MNIRDYSRIARRRWVSIALIAVLGACLGLGLSVATTKIYSANAQNFVAIGGVSGDPTNSVVFSGSTFALQRVKSYVNVVDTPTVLGPVIQELRLDLSIRELASMVSASNPPETVLLNVTVRGSDPELVTKLANTIAVQYAEEIERLETPDGSESSPVKVSTIVGATVPLVPVAPRPMANIAIGLLLGLGIGIAQAVLRDQYDTSIKSPRTLSEATGTAALGHIYFDPDTNKTPLVSLDAKSHRSDAYRTIRTNLKFIDVDDPPRILTITSALPDEGKTTASCNLAITMAQAGKSVCLVEADMRRPRLSTYLGIEAEIGLTDVLTGNQRLEEALLLWHRGLLSVLPVGTIPPNPSELLSSQHMSDLLAELRLRFDMVILDAAPLLPVADGAIVASITDGALLIARHGKTTWDQAEQACEALHRVDARLVGVVLNFVPEGKSGYGGYGYYSGQYAETSSKTVDRWGRKKEGTATHHVDVRS